MSKLKYVPQCLRIFYSINSDKAANFFWFVIIFIATLFISNTGITLLTTLLLLLNCTVDFFTGHNEIILIIKNARKIGLSNHTLKEYLNKPWMYRERLTSLKNG